MSVQTAHERKFILTLVTTFNFGLHREEMFLTQIEKIFKPPLPHYIGASQPK
jgi:hypothetical protein